MSEQEIRAEYLSIYRGTTRGGVGAAALSLVLSATGGTLPAAYTFFLVPVFFGLSLAAAVNFRRRAGHWPWRAP